MNINNILKQAIEKQASDVFIIAGRPVSFRKNNPSIAFTMKSCFLRIQRPY